MEIKLASELEQDARAEMSRIFAEGFGHWLTFFSKDTAVLSKAFAHMFLLDRFYVAVIDGRIAGIAACTDGKSASIRMDKRELKKHLGFYKGFLAGKILKPYLENHPYPFPLDATTGSIEYVGTAGGFRRQGVAAAIINHIIAHTEYRSYVLEVADTNESAVKLYEKLGFYEIHRTKEKHSKQSGVNFLVYMKYEKRVGIETLLIKIPRQ